MSHSPHEQTGTWSTIVDLPLEPLAEIFYSLSWEDILRIHKAVSIYKCHRSLKASFTDVQVSIYHSKARIIWADLFIRCSSSPEEEKPAPLERPIDMYTSQEIEYVLLRWKSAQMGWVGHDELPARERVISTVDAAVMHLMEGSRWLLVVDCHRASVSYYALEASDITGRILTPPVFEKDDQDASVLLAVDMDYTDSTLAFNLALSLFGNAGNAQQDYTPADDAQFLAQPPTVNIWHVELQLDCKQSGVALTAQRVASFLHLPEVKSNNALSLLGPHVAFGVYSKWVRQREYSIVVVDWDQAEKRGTHYSMVIIPRSGHPRSIRLLPHSRLLSISATQIKLYDYTSASQSLSISGFTENDAEVTMRPLWVVNMRDIIHWRVSEAFLSPHTTRVTFHDSRSLYGITITADMNPPTITKLVSAIPVRMRGSRWTASHYSTSVTVYDQKLLLMHYSWPTDSEARQGHQHKISRKHFGPKCASGLGPLFDIPSGRIVIAGPTRDQQTILDLALLYK